MTIERSIAAVHFLGCIALITALSVIAMVPQSAHAQSWPTAPTPWLLIDTDPNEPGAANYRDVAGAYFSNYDDDYLYLRLETYEPAKITNVSSRFKWLIDVGNGDNLYWSGQNILGADYILFLEDYNNDGDGEVYLLDAGVDDRFSQYEPTEYRDIPGPITNTSIANYWVDGNNVYLWVSLSALGDISDLTHVSLLWATDQQNPNLEQGPILDSTDVSDTPIHLDADLNVVKEVNNHLPDADGSGTVDYTITVTNTGPATATNIEITDSLPTGVTYQSNSTSKGVYIGDVWSIVSLANGESATLTITASVNFSTETLTITNTATITAVDQPDSHTGDNSDWVQIFLNQGIPDEADLSVLKDVSDHNPNEGNIITYTVTVTNTGPSDATGVVVTDTLPGLVTYNDNNGGSQGSVNDSGDPIIVWTVGTLVDGSSAILTITVTVSSGTAGSTITNTATATAVPTTDLHPDDNSDTAEFFVPQAPLPASSRGVPIFPSLYSGIATAFTAAVLAFAIRRRFLRQT